MSTSPFIWEEMTKGVTSIAPETHAHEALAMMRERRFRHLPVLDGDQLVGIVSDRDLVRNSPDLSVREVMSRDVKTCGLNDRVGEVADVMVEHRINAMPVVDAQNHVIGIITSTDILKYLRRVHRQATREPFEFLMANQIDIGDCED